MILRFFRSFSDSPQARSNFILHLEAGGKLRKFFILFFLFLANIPFFRKIPILSFFGKLSNNLWLGHLTEAKFSTDNSSTDGNNSEHSSADDDLGISNLYDIIVIGSGPGASTACMNLKSNPSVLVLEKGLLPRTSESRHHSLQHLVLDFEKAGQELIVGWPVAQFAQGSVLGGGSEVNSGLYHRLPPGKKAEFLSKARISSSEWDASEYEIEQRLNPVQMKVREEDSLIARGAANLGLEYKNVSRWRTYLNEKHFSHRGMRNLYWNHVPEKTRILLDREVTGFKSSVEAILVYAQNSSGERFTYKAKSIILSAGTINSPKILAKSGYIKWSDIKFQWHPMLRAVTRNPLTDLGMGDIDPYQAWTQDNRIKFGSAVSTPGLLSINLGQVLDTKTFTSFRSYYVSFTSSGVGGLFPNTDTPWYRYSQLDKQNFNLSRELLKNLISSGGGKLVNSEIALKPSTVHIFGSLPVQSDIYEPGTLRLKSEPRIQVCDGSLLPIGPGVNPQAIIMTTIKCLFKP